MGGGYPYSIYRGSLFCGNSHCFGGSVCLSPSLISPFLPYFRPFALPVEQAGSLFSLFARRILSPPHPTPLPFIAKEASPPPPLLTLPRKRIDRPVSLVLESTGGCFCESTNQPARIRPVRPPPPTPEDFTFTPVLSISGESAEL